jgi:hypothetical protein
MQLQAQRSYKYAALFGILCLGGFAASLLASSPLLQIVPFNAALAFGGVAIGYGALGPRVYGKRQARIPWWIWLVYWPYFALNYLSLRLFRRTSREESVAEIVPGLWLGCLLSPRDEKSLPTVLAVLDLTAEFSEVAFLQTVPHYLCVPVLDTTAPTLEELKCGVEFLIVHHRQGVVYVHCALGHGRSGTFVTAYLVASGEMETIDEALAHLRGIRPGIDLHPAQRILLEQYLNTLHDS